MTKVIITLEGETELPDELHTGERVAGVVEVWRELARGAFPELNLSEPATIELDDTLSVTVPYEG